MERIEIIGDNFKGKYTCSRTASRVVIIEDDRVLFTSLDNDTYMIPGGGLELNESIEECAIREAEEETGYIIKLSEPVLEIDEYYDDYLYKSIYFLGRIESKGTQKLTQVELNRHLKVEWLKIKDIINTLSKYNECDKEIKRGLFYREYRALSHILSERKKYNNKLHSLLGAMIEGVVDRPIGSTHPKHSDMIYPINYGYIEDFIAPDSEGEDVYILGSLKPIDRFKGKVIAIVERINDFENKLVVSLDNKDYSIEEIEEKVNFQEKYYKHRIIK